MSRVLLPQGNDFYICETGSLYAWKKDTGGRDTSLLEYGSADFFGELALLRQQVRSLQFRSAQTAGTVFAVQERESCEVVPSMILTCSREQTTTSAP